MAHRLDIALFDHDIQRKRQKRVTARHRVHKTAIRVHRQWAKCDVREITETNA